MSYAKIRTDFLSEKIDGYQAELELTRKYSQPQLARYLINLWLALRLLNREIETLKGRGA